MAAGAGVSRGAGGEGRAAPLLDSSEAVAVAGGERGEPVGGGRGEDSGGDRAGAAAEGARVGCGCAVAGIWAERAWGGALSE